MDATAIATIGAPAPDTVVETLDIARILQALPHRYPFLMIDRVVDLVTNQSAIGIKNVSVNESFFQGHFPSHPVMPGVLIIEAMAQTAAVLVVEWCRATSFASTAPSCATAATSGSSTRWRASTAPRSPRRPMPR